MKLKDRIYGCFLGKNIGGTLGMPYEGKHSFLDLEFYDPVPSEPVANDDLDLQVVWLEHVKEKGLAIDNVYLAEVWRDHADMHPDEYGVAICNIKKGLKPPLTGIHNNYFVNGMGAAIRSEIWASLFPGKPKTAAYYAYHDASVDHWNEGIHGEIFLTVLESVLYEGKTIRESIEFSLDILSDDSALKSAVKDVIRTYDDGKSYPECRDYVMRIYGNHNFTDCVMNLCFMMIGLLYGNGNFEKSLLYAVNCGQDADCTAASVGAIMGIYLGPDGIPEKWRNPIGEKIVIGDYIKDIIAPPDIGALVDEIERLKLSFDNKKLPEIEIPFSLPDVKDFSENIPWTVNGEKAVGEGYFLHTGHYTSPGECSIWLETAFRSSFSGDAQLLVCSEGMFRVWLDDKILGVWGDQTDIVPSFQRVKGGKTFNVHLTHGKHKIRIELLPTSPVPGVFIAFADMDIRHLTGIEYIDDKE